MPLLPALPPRVLSGAGSRLTDHRGLGHLPLAWSGRASASGLQGPGMWAEPEARLGLTWP